MRWAQPALPSGRGMDTDLVTRAQGGDEGAFASLAVAIGDRLHGVAFRILRDTDLAEDATQQALLNVWQDLPQLRDPARFDAWSYRLLVRACYAESGRARRWGPNLRLLESASRDRRDAHACDEHGGCRGAALDSANEQ